MLGQSVFEWTHKLNSACINHPGYAYLFGMRQVHFLKLKVSQGKATYTWVCTRMMPQTAPQFAFGCQGDCQTLWAALSQAHSVLFFIRHAFPDLFCCLLNTMSTHIWLVFYIWQHVYIWKLLLLIMEWFVKKKFIYILSTNYYTRFYERTLKKRAWCEIINNHLNLYLQLQKK